MMAAHSEVDHLSVHHKDVSRAPEPPPPCSQKPDSAIPSSTPTSDLLLLLLLLLVQLLLLRRRGWGFPACCHSVPSLSRGFGLL